jgi:CheY-like chemotaxis protein
MNLIEEGGTIMANSPCKVLVVDDNEDCAISVQMLLSEFGHEVRIAHTPPEAEALANVFQPDVVLMDLGLPGKNGYDLGREIKARCLGCRIIALSGYGDAEALRRSIEAEFEAHLVKPTEPNHLIQVVDEACSADASDCSCSS